MTTRKIIVYGLLISTVLLVTGFAFTTYQMGWSPLRTGVAADDTALDGTTAGSTYQFADKPARSDTGDPAGAIQVHPNWNNAQIVFYGTDAADETCNYKLYVWRADGPAMMVCSGVFTLGTAKTGGTNTFYADTITVTDVWPTDVVAADAEGNNRVATLTFDLLGASWIYCEIDIPAASQVATASAVITGF